MPDLPVGRAVTAAMIEQEGLIPKPEVWLKRNIPPECAVPHRTRPQLYWRDRVMAWWVTGTAVSQGY